MDQQQRQVLFQTTNNVNPPQDGQICDGEESRRILDANRINTALELLLDRHQENGCLVFNRAGGLSREHYAIEIGENASYFVKVCAPLLRKWDTKLRELRGGLRPKARALLDLIEADVANKVPLPSHGGTLDLEPYARKLGVKAGTLKSYLGARLKAYEAELRSCGYLNHQRAPDTGKEHAAKLQHFLQTDDKTERGIILNWRGNVSRSHYSQRLGIRAATLPTEVSAVLIEWDSQLAERRGGLNPLAYRFVQAVDEDRLSDAGIVVSSSGKINVSHYATKLGVSRRGVGLAMGNQLQDLNTKLFSEGMLKTPVEKALRREIEKDLAQGLRPLLGLGGKINRKHYAAKIGISHQSLVSVHKNILKGFDKEFGGDSNVEVYFDEMRAWLETQYESGLLQVRGGKIDRKLFEDHFGFKGGSILCRYPKITALFRDFDDRVASGRYMPAVIEADIRRLRDALLNPELNRNRLTISRKPLVKITGLSLGKLNSSPFLDEIKSKEQDIIDKAKVSLIDPYIAGRVFPFSYLPSWSTTFLSKLGAHFKSAFSHIQEKEVLKTRYHSLYNLLSWVGSSDHPSCCSIISSADAGEKFNLKEWELTVFAFREQIMSDIKNGIRSKSSANQALSTLRRVLARMQPFLPELTSDLPGVKYANALIEHRASLAEATSNPKSRKHGDYVEFAGRILRQAADRYHVDLDENEATVFVRVLADELARTSDLPSDLANAVLVVLDRRLGALREAAVQILQDARVKRAQGDVLLAAATIDAPAFCSEYQDRLVPQSRRRELLRAFFPDPLILNGEEAVVARQAATANLLALTVTAFDGIMPGQTNQKAKAGFGNFFQVRFQELGHFTRMTSFLNPDKHACGAALTLYLIESGANVAVGRTLDLNCIEDANTPGFKLITGFKARAKGKPIYVELPGNSDTVSALTWYAEHSARLRSKVNDKDAKSLFVLGMGNRCQLAPAHWYTQWFKRFASQLPAIGKAVVAPSMIRPSVLLKAALENDGRLTVGRAIGQHGASVTRGYQEKLPIRLLRDQHMRRFQGQFEVRLLMGITDIARALGIDTDEFDRRVIELQRSGLGTFCKDPYLRPGNEGKRCTTVDCWNDCPNLILIADVGSIALLQIWQQSLNEARGEWERDHPERWGGVWLPWLCLTEVVEERMSRGKLLTIWDDALVKAAELQAQPGFIAPRPY